MTDNQLRESFMHSAVAGLCMGQDARKLDQQTIFLIAEESGHIADACVENHKAHIERQKENKDAK